MEGQMSLPLHTYIHSLQMQKEIRAVSFTQQKNTSIHNCVLISNLKYSLSLITFFFFFFFFLLLLLLLYTVSVVVGLVVVVVVAAALAVAATLMIVVLVVFMMMVVVLVVVVVKVAEVLINLVDQVQGFRLTQQNYNYIYYYYHYH
jgi:hypothetical protein